MRRRSDLYCRPHAKSKRKFRLKQDRLSEAEVAMRRAVALDPHAYGYHFALGMVLKTRGNLREALQQLHPELDLNPELVPGREQIAALQATLQRARP